MKDKEINVKARRLKSKVKKYGMPDLDSPAFAEIKKEFISIYMLDKTLSTISDINLRFMISINNKYRFMPMNTFLSQIEL